jgi:Ca2+-transporting ATPase
MTKGNVTEQGVIKFFMYVMGGQGCIDFKNSLTEENILCIVPFTSKSKKGTIVVRNPALAGSDQEVRVYCKGAPDFLFEQTTQIVTPDGSIANINDETDVPSDLQNLDDDSKGPEDTDTYMGILNRTVKKFAKQAYRTILVAYRDMSMEEYEQMKASNNNFENVEDRECLQTNLTAIGIFGLQDPLRPTIVKSI